MIKKLIQTLFLVSATWGTTMAQDNETEKDVQRVEVLENPFKMPTFEESLKLADAGNPMSQYDVGNAYKDGRGTDKNIQEAIKWYTKAADQGFDLAMIALGEIYKTGDSIEQNYELALEWFQKAADQNSSFAIMTLGMAYFEGAIVAQDFERAYNYLLQAAENREAFAYLLLGMMDLEGQGREKDSVKAYMWLENAKASLDIGQGYEVAESLQNELKKTLTPEQIGQAEQMLIDWISKHG